MIELIIRNPDGSVYWREHFINGSDVDQWIAEEKSRPYWNPSFTLERVEIFPSSPIEDYRERRSKEYPSVGDQLDALFKLRHNNDATDSNAIDAAILAVKTKYPKPPAP